MSEFKLLDCTLRDGGYYNAWDFPRDLVDRYLDACLAMNIDVVELGFRSVENNRFLGPSAYTTDDFIDSLNVPPDLEVAVMINASELLSGVSPEQLMSRIFPRCHSETRVSIVRVACHVTEFVNALPFSEMLKRKGYTVCYNLMQVSGHSNAEILQLIRQAKSFPIDVLYFADSLGSMTRADVVELVKLFHAEWPRALGIHTHDNLGLALSNTLEAMSVGVSWADATITGMGRGPGNAKMEELAIEFYLRRGGDFSLVSTLKLIKDYFCPMQHKYGWGTNPYYYLAGKYGVHPSYIQQMLGDDRYGEEEMLSTLSHLRQIGGRKFISETLEAADYFYNASPAGTWSPKTIFEKKEVLILGSGPGVERYRDGIESFIQRRKPVVIAINTQDAIANHLVDFRIACHPLRLMTDSGKLSKMPQPLIIPHTMLPSEVQKSLKDCNTLDFGIKIEAGVFEFDEYFCTIPKTLVAAYALAVVTSGGASRLMLAGFDGYGPKDLREKDMSQIFEFYNGTIEALAIQAVTPTTYPIPSVSIYGLGN